MFGGLLGLSGGAGGLSASSSAATGDAKSGDVSGGGFSFGGINTGTQGALPPWALPLVIAVGGVLTLVYLLRKR